MSNGFGKSFDEAFKPAFAQSQAGAFDAIKEKIKQDQTKAEEKFKATTLMHSNIALATQFGDEDMAKKITSIVEAAGNSVDAQKNIGDFVSKSLAETQKAKQVAEINKSILGSVPGQSGPVQANGTQLAPSASIDQPAFSEQTGFKPTISGVSDSGVLKIDKDSPKEQATRALQIRGEISKDPIVKDFQFIKTNVEQMDTLLEKAKSGDLKGRNFLDQVLITTLQKTIDPPSVVRESEYARTPAGVALMNRLPALMEKVNLGGAGLTMGDREELVQVAKIIADVKGEAYNNQIGQYKELSKMFAVSDKAVLTGFSEHKRFLELPKTSDKDINSSTFVTSKGNAIQFLGKE